MLSTTSFSELVSHFAEHRRKHPFKCFLCGIDCIDGQEFIDHSQSHIKPMSFRCPKCSFETEDNAHIESHMQAGHEPKVKIPSKIMCPLCNMHFETQLRLKNHLNECGKKFSSKSKSESAVNNIKTEIKEENDGAGSIYTCPVCFFIFSNKLKLSEHVSTVHSKNKAANHKIKLALQESDESESEMTEECLDASMNPSVKLERIYLCPVCHFVFTSFSALNRHVITHKDVTECPICKLECETNLDLQEHVSSHTSGENQHNCSVCDENFLTVKDLTAHIKSKHSKSFKCPFCPRTIKTENALRLHIEGHSKLKAYRCPKCNFNAKNFTVLQVHMTKFHRPKKQFKCEYCLKSYKFKFSLQRHVENCPGKDSADLVKAVNSSKQSSNPEIEIDVSQKSSLNCSECDATFTEAVQLKKHLLIHFRSLPFRCIKCGYKCKLKHQLSEHLKTHKIVANYECRLCKKKFKHKHALNNHFITHTSERPFTCDICGVKFKRKSNYRRHYDGHSDVRPFECSKCDYSCHRRDSLLNHIQQNHSDEEVIELFNED